MYWPRNLFNDGLLDAARNDVKYLVGKYLLEEILLVIAMKSDIPVSLCHKVYTG